ncbi:hypothetical protein HRbin17_00596 [bacterium HR17]|uniref:YprB ribonuclease H-like domain-containing protein n=1 Tax=Candidatus Fervidibacter japonicus TaxID=2035412 RepID=A0A2H5XA82_9BACT|nr:hypothetical protein HRbin17_00596 [bacterium HR17]
MLTRTFLHFPQVGERRERALWRCGLYDWHAILQMPAFAAWRRFWDAWRQTAEVSLRAYARGDAAFFAHRLPRTTWWRAIPDFLSRAIFLDVETDGTDRVTVVGIADADGYRAFVRGQSGWNELRDRLASAALLVTYGGHFFDVPVLRANFPDWRLPPLQVDLCPLLRRLGYRGGLKAIERRLGLTRSSDIDGLTGWDAVRLWRRYAARGDETALHTLLAYNRADVVHLQPLLAFAYQQLWEQSVR